MALKISRRELMTRGLGTAGILAAGGVSAAPAEPQAPSKHGLPDRSKDAPSKPRRASRRTTALDLIGGIAKLVGGKTVTIKLNLTGGPTRKLGGLPAHRTYHVHPNMVAALCAAVHSAGARRIVMEDVAPDVLWRTVRPG